MAGISLPEEVVMEILSRLPAEEVLKLRTICHKWKSLMSTPHFAQMHIKAHTFPTILVQKRDLDCGVENPTQVYNWEQSRKIGITRQLCFNTLYDSNYILRFSYHGLMVINHFVTKRTFPDFVILNPITKDMVNIKCQIPDFYQAEVFGMYFHPQIKEYCMIWGFCLINDPGIIRFKMLSLGAKTCCRDLKPPPSWVHYVKFEDPVVIDKDDNARVYWKVRALYKRQRFTRPSCEELILAFDSKTEELSWIIHPGTDDHQYCVYTAFSIVKMNGHLSFVEIDNITGLSITVSIWTLKDYASRLWVKNHTVNIGNIDPEMIGHRGLKAVAIENGELLMTYSCIRFYAYRLKDGSVRSSGSLFEPPRNGVANIFSVVHVPSFVSLMNCKSEIVIRE